VTASIVHDDAGYRLLLSANDTGSAHFVTATYSGTDPFSLQSLNTDRNASGSFTSADLDAVIRVEGFQITSSSNTLDSAIDGVTLNLVANGSSTLTINRDDGTITKNAQSFTDSANKLLSTLRSMKSGALSNYGALLRGVETQVRSVLTSAVSAGGKFSLLDQLGISIQRDGTFTLDNTKLASALQSDFASVAAIFTDTTNGVAVKLNAVMNQYLQSGGILQSQTNGLNSRQTSIQDQQTAMQKRLDLIQARYTKQFSALDSLVANIQSTGSFLTRALG
jgi:flagellar hook-associated protein 2